MIKRFLEMAKDYLKQAGERKIRLVVAVLVSAALFAVSSVYLYEGFNKRLIIYTLLSLGTGALIVLPRLKRWYVSCPVVLLYVLMVPQKLFQRIELPVHNMEKLLGGGIFAQYSARYSCLCGISADHTADFSGVGMRQYFSSHFVFD